MQRNQKGVGLIEVLVTMLLLGTSLLALSALQLRSLQYNHGAYVRSQANIFIYDIVDRIRASQRFNIAPAAYNIDFNASVPNGAAQSQVDLHDWMTNLTTLVPGSNARIACDANGLCQITIRWVEQVDQLANTPTVWSTYTLPVNL